MNYRVFIPSLVAALLLGALLSLQFNKAEKGARFAVVTGRWHGWQDAEHQSVIRVDCQTGECWRLDEMTVVSGAEDANGDLPVLMVAGHPVLQVQWARMYDPSPPNISK